MILEIALGILLGRAAYAVLARVARAAFMVWARRSPTMLRWLEDDERKDAPLRDAVERGRR